MSTLLHQKLTHGFDIMQLEILALTCSLRSVGIKHIKIHGVII